MDTFPLGEIIGAVSLLRDRNVQNDGGFYHVYLGLHAVAQIVVPMRMEENTATKWHAREMELRTSLRKASLEVVP